MEPELGEEGSHRLSGNSGTPDEIGESLLAKRFHKCHVELLCDALPSKYWIDTENISIKYLPPSFEQVVKRLGTRDFAEREVSMVFAFTKYLVS